MNRLTRWARSTTRWTNPWSTCSTASAGTILFPKNRCCGTTEIWEFLNSTDDSHPIHLHLVRFQILDRRVIDVDDLIYYQKVTYNGNPVPPSPGEAGWKDTVVVTPGSSTRIIVKFEGYAGRYVWHCHILEHEDNEMMRPYEVVHPR